MPIETGIWRIHENADPVPLAGIDFEQHLQQIIASDLSIVDSRLVLIGREVQPCSAVASTSSPSTPMAT